MAKFWDRLKPVASSPKGEVGEIDTRAPFQSVKAAVSLFGQVKVKKPAIRRTRLSSENVLDRETQLLLAKKDLKRMKQKLDSAETTKARALCDLERAKRATNELTARLKAVNDSKKAAIQAAEEVKKVAKQLQVAKSQKNMGGEDNRNRELHHARENYISTATQINAAKQELNKIRQDFDATLEAKQAAFQQAAEAQRLAKASAEKVGALQKEISAMKKGIKQIKFATQQANEEQIKVALEKDYLMQSYKDAREAVEKKVSSLNKEYDPELCMSLDKELKETTEDIEVVQKQMKLAHAAKMETMRIVTTELNEAMKTLQEAAEKECSLRNLVDSLVLEVEEVKKECDELKEKEAEREAREKAAAENEAIAEQKEAEEHKLKLEKLSSETETSRKEVEQMTKEAEELKQEAETVQMEAKEAGKNLQLALLEVEAAKASENKARDELNTLSFKVHSDSKPDFASALASKITLPKEEFEYLNKKAQDLESSAEKKLAEALAQLDVINARKNNADTKLQANLTAIEEIKEATDMALKSAETAAAAQSMVEGELRRWRQQEEQITAA